MNWLSWIIFGGIAGWVASLIAGTNNRQGCILNIVVGIVGAFVGGVIMQSLTGAPFDFDFSPQSFVVAVIGSVILLALVRFVRRS